MKKVIPVIAILVTVLANHSFHPPVFSSKHFSIKQLAPGTWAAINNDNYGHAICNAGIIDLGDKTVIFDPFMNLDAARDLKIIAKQLTNKDATIIINSHYHNDHIRGNQLFLPASIISTVWTRDKIAVSEPEELEWEKANALKYLEQNRSKLKTAIGKDKEEIPLWIGYYEAMVTNNPLMKTTLPNVTFTDSLWIHGTKKSIKLVEYRNGHTDSDLILIVPKEGIAFMGDLLFEKRHPYLGHGDPKSWMKHLNGLVDDPRVHRFVPGHGEVTDKKYVQLMSRYIGELQQLVADGVKRQQSDSVIKATPIPASYADWKFGRFHNANLSFLTKYVRANAGK
ncbi:MAG TPA: MBL fold metallo-hydrolase [Segetibacter sp.]|jgi:glyoxylase-like metal-dependent hydrolase (beta-lactamase superfamily II)